MAITNYRLEIKKNFQDHGSLCILEKNYNLKTKLISELTSFLKTWDLADVTRFIADSTDVEKELKKNWNTFLNEMKVPEDPSLVIVCEYVPYNNSSYAIEVTISVEESGVEEVQQKEPPKKKKSKHQVSEKPSKDFINMLSPDLRGKVLKLSQIK